MGRLIIYDNVVQDQLNSIIKKNSSETGLIIGQCTEQKDFAVRLCPTPKNDDENLPKEKTKDEKKTSSKDSIDLDEPWICQHAKQLLRALPGGFEIIGFYVVAPSDNSSKYQAELKQVLLSIFKILSKSSGTILGSKQRTLLTICPNTSKTVCRTFDISDYKSSANPADWKQQAAVKWQRLRCQVAVDVKRALRSEHAGLALQRQIELGLAPFLESVGSAHALVDGLHRDPEEALDGSSASEGKRSKRKQGSDKVDSVLPLEWHDVELFLPLAKKSIVDNKEFQSACMMTFKGTMQCRAFVHGKASVKEAIEALKQDVIRTITARCEIHCEDLLLIEEEQEDPQVVHELPRRVFAPLPQPGVCVCDYQFHSDAAADSLSAFRELLDLHLREEDIDTSCEVSPTTSTLILPEVLEDRLSEFGDAPPQSSMNTYIPVIGIIATSLIAAISYILASSSS